MSLTITILGSGTSTGVPIIGCPCPVCNSNDPKNKRLRASIFVQSKNTSLVVDTGPDFRYQMIRENINTLDAVLYTHIHYDHVGGFDDIRPFSYRRKSPFPCYADSYTIEQMKTRHPYIESTENYSSSRPQVNFIPLQEKNGMMQPFTIGDIQIQPIKMLHVKDISLRSYGYVFNRQVGYLTDFKEIDK
ncbi:MAG: MBL fold metallo-hydrolase, partial [Candidatus Hydrogenedentota bacterium]